MKPLVRILLALALVAPLAGCPSPTATGTAGFESNFDTGPAGPGLTTLIGPEKVVLYAVPPNADAVVVDYVIQVLKTNEIVMHVEYFNAAAAFRLEVERGTLPTGVYKMKVYVDKAKTPFDEREITVP